MKRTLLALAVLSALSGTAIAATPSSTTLDALEARLKTLEENAEAQRKQTADALAALEQARAEIEQLKANQSTVAEATASPGAEPASIGGADNPNVFNPAISIILNGSYSGHSLDPDAYQRSGFPLVGEGGPSAKGFSLGESEIAFSTNIDEKFYGQMTLAIGVDGGEAELAVEEAFIDTTALPAGFTLRAGRFFSDIGYLNTHHAHTDKFFDRPLAYQAFLANQYGDSGLQLRWVAPTDLFIELGGEFLRGDNYPSGGAGNGGGGVKTLFAHVGGDVGTESSWLAGVSALRSRTEGAEDGFVGDNTLYLADATWKWAPQGNFKDGGVTVRGEYFVDDRDGNYIDAADSAFDQLWKGTRRGAYVESVYRINRNWEAGYRYDKLWADDNGPYASSYDPDRHSGMLSWLNSEFSLLRLQYSHDRPNATDTDNALTLQYQVALGAHGAHKF